MVEVTEDYRFTAADGTTRTLVDLFEGRHQLIVDHYTFDPEDLPVVLELRQPPPTRRSTVVSPGLGLVAHPLGRGVIEGGRRRLSSDTSGEA